jgi:hypothetical protein
MATKKQIILEDTVMAEEVKEIIEAPDNEEQGTVTVIIVKECGMGNGFG